jgi:phospholipase D-like protein
MQFVTRPEIGKVLLEKLRTAVEVRIASAFFNPDNRTLDALKQIPALTLIISEEFVINDPRKLEKLPKRTTLRSIPVDHECGKLHAKVILVKQHDGSIWGLIGSANVTWAGLFSNQETCLILTSRDPSDSESLNEMTNWFCALLARSRIPDLSTAKRIFDARNFYRLEPRPTALPSEGATYWVLKTTSGGTREDHWANFLAESVIALGWADIPDNPAFLTEEGLIQAVASAHPDDNNPRAAAHKIRAFIDMKIGDVVLMCKGYVANQKTPVFVYGFARVTGTFRDDTSSSWNWRFKHDAVIQPIESFVPKDAIAASLGKGSMRQALHRITREGFEAFSATLGLPIKV